MKREGERERETETILQDSRLCSRRRKGIAGLGRREKEKSKQAHGEERRNRRTRLEGGSREEGGKGGWRACPARGGKYTTLYIRI